MSETIPCVRVTEIHEYFIINANHGLLSTRHVKCLRFNRLLTCSGADLLAGTRVDSSVLRQSVFHSVIGRQPSRLPRHCYRDHNHQCDRHPHLHIPPPYRNFIS